MELFDVALEGAVFARVMKLVVEIERAIRRKLYGAACELVGRDVEICRDAVELRQVELGDVEKDVVSQTMVFLLQAVAGEQTRKLFFGQVCCGYVQVDEVSGKEIPPCLRWAFCPISAGRTTAW